MPNTIKETDLPQPSSNSDKYLYNIARNIVDTSTLPEPMCNIDKYLLYLCQNKQQTQSNTHNEDITRPIISQEERQLELLNDWQSLQGPTNVKVLKQGRICIITGMVKKSDLSNPLSSEEHILTLPNEFRPANDQYQIVSTNTSNQNSQYYGGTIRIKNTGEIYLVVGGGEQVNLSGISFVTS